jgi:hypothetical protein
MVAKPIVKQLKNNTYMLEYFFSIASKIAAFSDGCLSTLLVNGELRRIRDDT